jgi:hypothetical protein
VSFGRAAIPVRTVVHQRPMGAACREKIMEDQCSTEIQAPYMARLFFRLAQIFHGKSNWLAC